MNGIKVNHVQLHISTNLPPPLPPHNEIKYKFNDTSVSVQFNPICTFKLVWLCDKKCFKEFMRKLCHVAVIKSILW